MDSAVIRLVLDIAALSDLRNLLLQTHYALLRLALVQLELLLALRVQGER